MVCGFIDLTTKFWLGIRGREESWLFVIMVVVVIRNFILVLEFFGKLLKYLDGGREWNIEGVEICMIN